MLVRRALISLLFATLPVPRSADAASIASLATYGAFETGSARIDLADYDAANRNETARGWIKRTDEPDDAYREFHPFVRYDGNHMITSLFDLLPDTSYDVRVELHDPDTGVSTANATLVTRPEYVVPGGTRQFAVDTSTALQAAIDGALPGDRIAIAPGDYFDTVQLWDIDGTEAAPIVLAAADTAQRPHFYRGIQSFWSSYVVLDHLEVEAIDPSDPRVTDPVALGYGSVDFRGSHYVVITGCFIHDGDEEGAGGAYRANIFIEHNDENQGADKNGYFLIQDNVIADEIHPSWPWDDSNSSGEVPGHTYVGIKFDFSPGGFNVVRRNCIYGHIDGIGTGGDEGQNPPDPEDLDILADYPNQNIDVYDNVIYHQRDDSIETDGHTVNGRFFRNRLGECMNAISTAPVYPGPLFIVRNEIGGFKENVSKLNTGVGGVTRNVFWYHNTAVQPDFAPKTDSWCLYRGMPGYTRDLTYLNNIFVARRRVIDSDISGYHLGHRFDHNNVYSHRFYDGAPYTGYLYLWGEIPGDRQYYQTFEDFRAGTGQETHGIYAEPVFDPSAPPPSYVRPAEYQSDQCSAEDYFLAAYQTLPGSPGIDAAAPVPGINDAFAGAGPDCGAYERGLTVGIEEGAGTVAPAAVAVAQSRPNPFGPETTIAFTVRSAGRGPLPVRVEMFDARGRLVRALLDARLDLGAHVVTWDGSDDRGHRAPAGAYFCRVRAGASEAVRRIIRIR